MGSLVNFTTPAEIGWKSLQGVEYVPIKDVGNGVKIRRTFLKDEEVLPHVHTLFAKAWRDLQELQAMQGLPTLSVAPTDFNGLVQSFKSGTSDVVQVPCDLEDRMARIISLVQEGFALLAYIMGEDILQNEIAGSRKNNLLN